jgi:hypothetical protein
MTMTTWEDRMALERYAEAIRTQVPEEMVATGSAEEKDGDA